MPGGNTGAADRFFHGWFDKLHRAGMLPAAASMSVISVGFFVMTFSLVLPEAWGDWTARLGYLVLSLGCVLLIIYVGRLVLWLPLPSKN